MQGHVLLHVFATGVTASNQAHTARHRSNAAGFSRAKTRPKMSHKWLSYGNFSKVPDKPV